MQHVFQYSFVGNRNVPIPDVLFIFAGDSPHNFMSIDVQRSAK